MDRLFNGVNRYGDYKMPSIRIGRDKGITVIRCADDFVTLAPSKEILESYVIPTIKTFLSQRGLSVNETKTYIKHRSESFNFLGFTTKLFESNNRRSLTTKPDKKRVHRYISYIKSIISNKKQISADDLIKQLNPIIRGWTNYYAFASSKKIFSYVDYRLFKLLWRWCKRRHPKKSSQWVMDKYFRRIGSRKWTFAGEEEILFYHADVPYKRYVQTKIRASPYDPLLKDYWKNKYTATSYL
jgi:RNA-directed DNA polymerase